MKLSNAIELFLNDSKIYKSYETFYFYKRMLTRFQKFLISDIDINDNILNLINDFIIFLKPNNKNNTINKYICSLNLVFKFNKLNYKIENLKNDTLRFNGLTSDEVIKIKLYLSKLSLEKRIYIKLLFDTGARISELLNIKNINIDFVENRILLINTKNKVPRYIFFSEDTKKDLLVLYSEKEFLFTINDNIIYKMFKKIKKDLKIKSLHSHMFRHTFATRMLYSGTDIYAVSMFLGHKDIKTTQNYLHYDNNMLQKIYLDKINNIYKNI